MCKARVLTPEDRRFLVAIKESLAVPHTGLAPLPRKVGAMAMNRSESFYSRLTDPAQVECIPDVVDLRRYISGTGNPEPMRVLQSWAGEAMEQAPEPNPFHLLAQSEKASTAFQAHLSELLSDGSLSKADAIEMLPLAQGLLQQTQKSLDALRKRAGRP